MVTSSPVLIKYVVRELNAWTLPRETLHSWCTALSLLLALWMGQGHPNLLMMIFVFCLYFERMVVDVCLCSLMSHSLSVLPWLASNTAFLPCSWACPLPARTWNEIRPYALEAADGRLLVAKVLLLLVHPWSWVPLQIWLGVLFFTCKGLLSPSLTTLSCSCFRQTSRKEAGLLGRVMWWNLFFIYKSSRATCTWKGQYSCCYSEWVVLISWNETFLS